MSNIACNALRLARPYVQVAVDSWYDGPRNADLQNEARQVVRIIDGALNGQPVAGAESMEPVTDAAMKARGEKVLAEFWFTAAPPDLTDEDRSFLHDNPNTEDLVNFVQAHAIAHARAAVKASQERRSAGAEPADEAILAMATKLFPRWQEDIQDKFVLQLSRAALEEFATPDRVPPSEASELPPPSQASDGEFEAAADLVDSMRQAETNGGALSQVLSYRLAVIAADRARCAALRSASKREVTATESAALDRALVRSVKFIDRAGEVPPSEGHAP